MNLNGSRSRVEDDDLDDMVSWIFLRHLLIFLLDFFNNVEYVGQNPLHAHYFVAQYFRVLTGQSEVLFKYKANLVIQISGQVFSEHQLAKLKKSEAFSVEREREIQQASEDFCTESFH